MKKLTRRDCAQWLSEQDNFLILTHRRPDGDTVGSAAALCLGLRKLGKTAHILANPEITPRFAHLHEGLTVPEPAPGMVLVSADVASPSMLPETFAPLAELTTLRIDHHGTADSFTPLECVDSTSASCAELIWDILELLGCNGDKAIAEAVYTGLSTDTGCFRFANTTAHTFEIAAACAALGADIFGMNQSYFETQTLTKLKMQAWLVEHMHLLDEGRLAVCAIPKAVETEIGVTPDDMDNIANFPRSIDGVKMAATVRQDTDGKVKISVRAVPGYDAAKVCAAFGGGGHKGAAGASFHMGFAEAVKAVEKAMLEARP